MKTEKPDLKGMTLDDFIATERPKKKVGKKKKGKGGAAVAPSQVDYEKFSDDQIRKELAKRGMTTKGSRKKLVARLQHCVKQAWEKYNKTMNKNKAPKKPKKKLTPEEKLKITEQNEANRAAKLKKKLENKRKADAAQAANRELKAKRRMENKRKAEEARERKRLKTEARLNKQNNYEAEQKKQKEARQKLEAHANFDMKTFAAQLRKKLDPKGNKISSITYDFSKKGFVIKFKQAKFVDSCTKGSTIKKLTSYKLNLTASLLPAPIESHCAFFLSPTAANHPNRDAAAEWLSEQGGSDAPELEKLQLWIDDALSTFASSGTIVNVFRERGFLVVQFSDSAGAQAFLSANKDGEFNNVPFVFLKEGTPTKRDKNDCDKEYPMPKKKKTKKQ